jgi:hypothetical protein
LEERPLRSDGCLSAAPYPNSGTGAVVQAWL